MRRQLFPKFYFLNFFRTFKTVVGNKLLNDTEVKAALNSSGTNFTIGKICAKIRCTLCGSKTNDHFVYINLKTGWFVCQHAKFWGEWSLLQKYISLKNESESKKLVEEIKSECNKENIILQDYWLNSLNIDSIESQIAEKVQSHHNILSLSRDAMAAYGVRVVPKSQTILLPHTHFADRLLSLKLLRSLALKNAPDVIEVKGGTSVDTYPLSDSGSPGGGTLVDPVSQTETFDTYGLTGLFGMRTVKSNQREVILTNDEFDALALYQNKLLNPDSSLYKKNMAILALPKGDTNLPQEILPLLEQFDKITFWFSGDVRRCWDASKSFANKLDNRRCFLVQPKDSNIKPMELLTQGVDATDILKSSSINLAPKSITHFQHMRQEVYTLIKDHKKFQGIEWKRFVPLNNILKGHRRGELTVFTGPTGSGKTTFISEYSLDLCMNGVNTLWGSFEIPNTRLMKIMLQQFSKKNLEKNLLLFQGFADKFEKLQMFFLTHYGPTSTKSVIECMSQAVYLHDISHVVIDNLQFMLGDEASVSSFDRYIKQDAAIAMFRKFATYHNCHVTLIIHPRKEMTEELHNYSIFGGAKATQEADNVMILQEKDRGNGQKFKYVQVTKNRFNGKLGVIPLVFDRETQQFNVTVDKITYERVIPTFDGRPALMPLPHPRIKQ